VEVKPKMVMTVFACLMAKDYVPNMDSKKTWKRLFFVYLNERNVCCWSLAP
jgi:hypothetical protein